LSRELASHQLVRDVHAHNTAVYYYSISILNPTDQTQETNVKRVHEIKASQETDKEHSRTPSLQRKRSKKFNSYTTKVKDGSSSKTEEYFDEETDLIQLKAELEADTTLLKTKLETKEKTLSLKREMSTAEAAFRVMNDSREQSEKDTELSSSVTEEQSEYSEHTSSTLVQGTCHETIG